MNARSINISYGPITEFPYCGDERTGLKHITITITEQLRAPRGVKWRL